VAEMLIIIISLILITSSFLNILKNKNKIVKKE